MQTTQKNLVVDTLPSITEHCALFLDFDGTLVELAAQPEAVVIPPSLPGTLASLYVYLGGALALVSGRRLLDLDAFLAPLQLPSAVEHGAQRRNAEGLLISAPSADMRYVLRAAQDLLDSHPGLKLEKKNLALSLHYRHAPELEALCLSVMRAAVARSNGLELIQGKYVIDLKPSGVSKGTAIAAFMTETPFAGRTPIFAGDDVTDESGFSQVQRMGGHAVKVGAGQTIARHRCVDVQQLSTWLESALTEAVRASPQPGPRKLPA
ncbi:trehalose-phosphatase [Polaromonas sp. A23]|uniref:trehalose-phosphatase n=1 Tax=Polaromonas sp. A23 TaxID=1944133 RepID=UPI000985475F|nr:trehalose-phosphatase [Polaromonas sp. A23]OOG43999.1 trehalose-phosphatase [Polaromonas sp. A23]